MKEGIALTQDKNLSKLPDTCYSTSDYSGEVILIKKGELGYYLTPYSVQDRNKNREIADSLNVQQGVTRAQAEAMKAGSIFGWDIPAVDPEYWIAQDRPPIPAATNEYDDEKAFSLNNGEYFLYIQTCDSGYDYTIYHGDYQEYDGGQLDEPSMTIGEAALYIINDFSRGRDAFHIETYDPDTLQEAVYGVEAAEAADIISAAQASHLQKRIEEAQARSTQQAQEPSVQEKGARLE